MGSRQAAPPSIEALEPRTLLTGESFLLHSLPGATKRIYLDFNGHTTIGTSWNQEFVGNGLNDSIVTTAFSLDEDTSAFSAAEEQLIEEIWRVVSEDFAPFDVDVTTQDPGVAALRKAGPADTEWGIRVVIGGDSGWYPEGAVGVAYLNSFTFDSDTPAFVFADRLSDYYTPAPFLPYVDTISHEVGHTLGLEHDGISIDQEFGDGERSDYYYGHSVPPFGDMVWAPIMGSPIMYDYILSQWSNGNYTGATEDEDDLAIITTDNGFGYRPDDHGNTIEAAGDVTVDDSQHASASGIIERGTDADYFKFYVAEGGTVQIDFASALSPDLEAYDAIVSNLDILGTLYDAEGQVVASSNPADSLEASLSLDLEPGFYYLSIDGVGLGDPLALGYSDYGSLGQYAIAVTIATGSLNFPNTPPTDILLNDTTIAENFTPGRTVGLLSSTDNNVGDTFTYSLVSGEGDTGNSQFGISSNRLVTTGAFDFETQTLYSVRVRTTDQDGSTFEKVFLITVSNVNDAPDSLTLSSSTIAETNSNPATIGTLSATDVESDGPFTFTLATGIGSTDNPKFSIVDNVLQIHVTTDFEVKSSYSIRIRVTDQGGATLSKQFTIQVTDIDESIINLAPTDILLSTSSLIENAVAGTEVALLSAVDANAGNSFTFTLIDGLGSNDNSHFVIHGNALVTNIVANFESRASYSIRVKVSDQGGLAFEKSLTISIADTNESPSMVPNQSFTSSEGLPNGATIGTVIATDPDVTAPNNTLTYAIVSGNTGNAFAIHPATGEIGVNDHLALDYDTTPQFLLEVMVTDGGTGNLTGNAIVIINLTELNDPPALADGVEFSLPEHSPLNTTVGTVTAIDPNDGSALTFRIVAGNTSSAFAIDANSGLLKVANPAAINFETTSTLILTIQVQDEFGLTDTSDVTINLTDIDDNLQVQLGGGPVTWINRQPPSAVLPEVTITGVVPVAGRTLIVTVNAVGTAKKVLDSFAVPRYGAIGTSAGLRSADGRTTLQIQLNTNTSAAQIVAFLRGMTFSTKGKGLKVATRTVTVTLTDGVGSTTTLSQTINVRKKA